MFAHLFDRQRLKLAARDHALVERIEVAHLPIQRRLTDDQQTDQKGVVTLVVEYQIQLFEHFSFLHQIPLVDEYSTYYYRLQSSRITLRVAGIRFRSALW